jgi:NADPH-dependent 2,4-dienoyl-CoA reductase/sulfur reductase-like enzyme
MHVAILGNGVAGVSTALRLRALRPDWRITIVSGESTHHYSRPALMYVFMGHMRYADTKPFPDTLWAERRIDLVRDWVTAIDVERHELTPHRGTPIHFDKLVIATGSKPNKFGWPGQDLPGVQGLWGLYDLQLLNENVKHAARAVVVGGGLIGIELAEMLHSRGLDVSILVREESYWSNILPAEESQMVNAAIRASGMDLRLETELAEIVGVAGRVGAVVTKAGERIDCGLVGLTVGVSPNVDVAKGSGIDVGRGVLVDRSLRTSVPDVFAAGDCAEIVTPKGTRNVINQVWYTGKMQGETLAAVLAGDAREYDPGIWFNSAKFLDLEYQTYGRVVPGELESLFWSDDAEKRSIRIVHADGRVTGFNLMGVRWRHVVCERWLAEKATVEHVLDHIEDARFDPELGGRASRCELAARDSFRSVAR